jgi:hypothetical protein
MAGTAGKSWITAFDNVSIEDFAELITFTQSATLRSMRDVAERHMAEGKSIIDRNGLTTEQRYVVYQCELIRRGKE